MSNKLFAWAHRIALFAIVFASLAPSISHALVAQNGVSGFVQQICTSDGRIIFVQEADIAKSSIIDLSDKNAPSPNSILQHLNHCPFCTNPIAKLAIEAPNGFVFGLFSAQKQQIVNDVTDVVLPRHYVLLPPPRAPPAN